MMKSELWIYWFESIFRVEYKNTKSYTFWIQNFLICSRVGTEDKHTVVVRCAQTSAIDGDHSERENEKHYKRLGIIIYFLKWNQG